MLTNEVPLSPNVPFLVLGYLMISLGHSTASLWLMESWGLFPFSQVQGTWPHDLTWTGDPAWSVACVPCLPSDNITTCLQWGLFLWPGLDHRTQSQGLEAGPRSVHSRSRMWTRNHSGKPRRLGGCWPQHSGLKHALLVWFGLLDQIAIYKPKKKSGNTFFNNWLNKNGNSPEQASYNRLELI